jgi:hypothetical protein
VEVNLAASELSVMLKIPQRAIYPKNLLDINPGSVSGFASSIRAIRAIIAAVISTAWLPSTYASLCKTT